MLISDNVRLFIFFFFPPVFSVSFFNESKRIYNIFFSSSGHPVDRKHTCFYYFRVAA